MEEEASRISQGQTFGENSLPAGQSGGRKYGEFSLELTSKDSKNAKRKKKGKRSRDKKRPRSASPKKGHKKKHKKEGNTNKSSRVRLAVVHPHLTKMK